MHFSELADEYIAQWTGKSDNQICRVGYWADAFGNYRLSDVTADMIRKQLKLFEATNCTIKQVTGEIRRLSKKLSPTTVNRYRTVLSSMFRFAILEGYLTVNPVSRVICKIACHLHT